MKRIIKKDCKSRLQQFLKENNLSKTELAKMCGLSVSAIDGFMAGKNVRMVTLVKISLATKIHADELVGF